MTCAWLKGQGATEYLVLLAVVLIIAVVTIALLGFFPGTADDAQIAESNLYWRSAAPIAIIETAATTGLSITGSGSDDATFPYLRVRNTGSYPLRITKVFSGTNNGFVDSVAGFGGPGGDTEVLASHYYLSPGEEKSFISSFHSGCRSGRFFYIVKNASRFSYIVNGSYVYLGDSNSSYVYLGGAQSTCRFTSSDGRNFGNVYIKEFGFEYMEYIDGQTITKTQMGKALVIKCTGPTPTPGTGPTGWPDC